MSNAIVIATMEVEAPPDGRRVSVALHHGERASARAAAFCSELLPAHQQLSEDDCDAPLAAALRKAAHAALISADTPLRFEVRLMVDIDTVTPYRMNQNSPAALSGRLARCRIAVV
jgi:hypothetical protein